MQNSVDIVEVAPIRKNSATVITGFYGPGFIANSSLMHIVRNKGFRLKAHIKSQLIPPMMLLIGGRLTTTFRIYGNEDDSLLLVICDSLIPTENTWTVGKRLMEWLQKKGVKEFYAIEAMSLATQSPERPIFAFSIPAKDLDQYGVRPVAEGGISGVNAVLIDEAITRKIPFTTLLVATPLAAAIDYGGTASIVEALNRIFKFGVDTSNLKRGAEMQMKMTERMRGEKTGGILGAFRRKRSNSGSN
jgi:predicted ATP-grasp superfamily ATP-dependent carboligase